MFETISYRSFRQEEHLQYNTDADRLLQDVDMEAWNIDTVYPAYKAAWSREKEQIEYISKSEYTAMIKNNNEIRNGVFKTIVQSVAIQLNAGSNAALRADAQRISICVRHYRKTHLKPISERNSTFRKFIHDLREGYAPELERLSLKPLVAQLEGLSTALEQQLDKRTFTKAGRKANIQAIRKETEVRLEEIKTVLRATFLLNESSESVEFLKKFNGLTQFYKQRMKARKKSKKEEAVVSE